MNEAIPAKANLKEPCGACPFRRSTEPGALGGSPPEVFIGQAHGPFWIPCHRTYEPGVSAKEQRPDRAEQCAGCAIYRSNVEVADRMPEPLLRLPADKDKVFATPAEFIKYFEAADAVDVMPHGPGIVVAVKRT